MSGNRQKVVIQFSKFNLPPSNSKQAVFDGKKAIRGGIPFVFRKLFNFDLNRFTISFAQGTPPTLPPLLCVPAMSCQSSMMDDDRFRLTQQFLLLPPPLLNCPRAKDPQHLQRRVEKILDRQSF